MCSQYVFEECGEFCVYVWCVSDVHVVCVCGMSADV